MMNSVRSPRLGAVSDDDCNISDLPDDVLRQILRRLDVRTALGTGVLSKRWAGLTRELPSLDLKVADILPRDYYLELRRRDEAKRSFWVYDYGKKYDTVIRRYERRAMRAMAACMKELSSSSSTTPRRRVDRLTVEFIDTNSSNHINRLITTAVDAWGVEHLDVAAAPVTSSSSRPLEMAYRFPDGRISDDPHSSRLKTLKLTKCRPPNLLGFDALTTLVLRDLPLTTRAAVYERAVASCPSLQVLHLVSCQCRNYEIVIDAPLPGLRELVLDDGDLNIRFLHDLPKLETLVSVQNSVELYYYPDAAPCLARASLAFHVGQQEGDDLLPLLERFKRESALSALGYFCRVAMNVTDLVLRLTGPQMWVVPESPFLEMPSLRRLLVADVPPRWDTTWIRAVVEEAPSLERLHVHFSQQHYRQDGDEPAVRRRLEIVWGQEPSRSPHCHLEELVVVGFQSKKERQVQFVRYVMEASMALRRVVLIKHGRVEDRGPGEWEMVSQKCTWSDEEKLAVKEQIMEGVCCSMDRVEVVLE